MEIESHTLGPGDTRYVKVNLPDVQFMVPHVRHLEITVLTTNKQLNKLKKKSTILLRSVRELRSQGKVLPPKLERHTGK